MNAVVWFEIYVKDMTRARGFYEKVLGKKLEKLPVPDMDGESGGMEMWTFPGGGEAQGAAGALVKMEGAPQGFAGTMVYFGCADCGVEAGRIPGAGGKVIRPKMSIGPYGFIVLAEDSEGNMIGLHSMA